MMVLQSLVLRMLTKFFFPMLQSIKIYSKDDYYGQLK